jgi:hypothetical protein
MWCGYSVTFAACVMSRVTDLGSVGAGQRRHCLASVRRERVDVDQGPYVGIAGRRVADDRAAVEVADERGRAGERPG